MSRPVRFAVFLALCMACASNSFGSHSHKDRIYPSGSGSVIVVYKKDHGDHQQQQQQHHHHHHDHDGDHHHHRHHSSISSISSSSGGSGSSGSSGSNNHNNNNNNNNIKDAHSSSSPRDGYSSLQRGSQSRYLDDDSIRADEFRFVKAKDISEGPHLAAPGKTPNLLPTPGFIEGRPHCARELDLCAHNHDYPLDKVSNIVDRFYSHTYDLYHSLYQTPPQEVQWVENVTNAFTHEKHHGDFACKSESTYLKIGWAKNYKGHWKAVVNTERFPQTARIEKCKFREKPCDYMPPCYRTACKQREMLYPLIAVNPYDPSQKPLVDLFPLPSGCVCYVDDTFFHKK